MTNCLPCPAPAYVLNTPDVFHLADAIRPAVGVIEIPGRIDDHIHMPARNTEVAGEPSPKVAGGMLHEVPWVVRSLTPS
ncbi:MAG: hypothetical protein WDO18_03015 [Acidobacteriota bacterium]